MSTYIHIHTKDILSYPMLFHSVNIFVCKADTLHFHTWRTTWLKLYIVHDRVESSDCSSSLKFSWNTCTSNIKYYQTRHLKKLTFSHVNKIKIAQSEIMLSEIILNLINNIIKEVLLLS